MKLSFIILIFCSVLFLLTSCDYKSIFQKNENQEDITVISSEETNKQNEEVQTENLNNKIDMNWDIVILSFERKLNFIDPVTNKIVHEIDLGKFAIDYSIAPNGKVYIPLHEDPKDNRSYVAILDRKEGTLKKVPTKFGAMGAIEITEDGTAFIETGSTPDNESMSVLIFDTNTDSIYGHINVPGFITSMTSYKNNEVLVATQDMNDFGGKVFIVGKQSKEPKSIFDTELEPSGPTNMLYDSEKEQIYLMYPGNDDKEKQDMLKDSISDKKLFQDHIDTWSLTDKKLTNRIFLDTKYAREMIWGSKNTIFVGHHSNGTETIPSNISIINIESNLIEKLETVSEPYSLHIKDNKLYVGSDVENIVDIFNLSDLKKITSIEFTSIPQLPIQ